jgi:hypothetical protein
MYLGYKKPKKVNFENENSLHTQSNSAIGYNQTHIFFERLKIHPTKGTEKYQKIKTT